MTSWKNRVWFVEKNTANGWYLPVGSVTGAATKFNFGSRFRKGGELAGLWSWTIDGGAGVDDHLVAISTAGEVQVWHGTDPDTVDAFNLIGTWDIGTVPLGRRFVHNFDGDLLIFTKSGILSLSKILSGVGNEQAGMFARKVNPLLSSSFSRAAFAYSSGYYFFAEHPQERTLNLFLPSIAVMYGLSGTSVSMSRESKAWATHGRVFSGGVGGLHLCAAVYDGNLYVGNNGSTVYVSVAGNDSQAANGTGGFTIIWYILFRPLGYEDATQKVAVYAKGRFSGPAGTHGLSVIYDYEQNPTITSIRAALGSGTYWNGLPPAGSSPSSGRTCALLLAGQGSSTVTGADMIIRRGGVE